MTPFDNVLDQCLAVASGEEVLLLADDGTDATVLTNLTNGISERGAVPLVARMPCPRLPGAAPPAAVAAMMLDASAIIELTSLFIGSSAARRAPISAAAVSCRSKPSRTSSSSSISCWPSTARAVRRRWSDQIR